MDSPVGDYVESIREQECELSRASRILGIHQAYEKLVTIMNSDDPELIELYREGSPRFYALALGRFRDWVASQRTPEIRDGGQQ